MNCHKQKIKLLDTKHSYHKTHCLCEVTHPKHNTLSFEYASFGDPKMYIMYFLQLSFFTKHDMLIRKYFLDYDVRKKEEKKKRG